MRNEINSCSVAINSKSTNDSDGFVAQITVVSKAFPSMNIRDVQLQEWKFRGKKSIPYRHAGMCECAWVDDHKVDVSAGFVEAVDNCSLVV